MLGDRDRPAGGTVEGAELAVGAEAAPACLQVRKPAAGGRQGPAGGVDREQLDLSAHGRELAGRHRRVFAAHQQITDPAHREALERLRRGRAGAKRPAGEDVQVRGLAVYDRLAA